MNHYLSIFCEIDQKDSGRIAIGELQQYVAKNHIDAELIEQWRKKFDPKNSGVIKVEEILKYLHVTDAQYQIFRQANEKHQKDVRYIWGDMPIEQQVDVTNQIRNYLKQLQNDDFYQISSKLKKYMDEKYGRAWNAVVTEAAYSSAFSHDPFTSFQFAMGGHSFSLWRSEEEKPKVKKP